MCVFINKIVCLLFFMNVFIMVNGVEYDSFLECEWLYLLSMFLGSLVIKIYFEIFEMNFFFLVDLNVSINLMSFL